jgi:hypothetical protein
MRVRKFFPPDRGRGARAVAACPYGLSKGLPGGIEVMVMKPFAEFEDPSFDKPKWKGK